jgi:hypothetical protein
MRLIVHIKVYKPAKPGGVTIVLGRVPSYIMDEQRVPTVARHSSACLLVVQTVDQTDTTDVGQSWHGRCLLHTSFRVVLVQSQRRKQFPKNSVVSPRGRRATPVPFSTIGKKVSQARRRPRRNTLTHEHTHARCNTHAAASCRCARGTRVTLQSRNPRVSAPRRVVWLAHTSEGSVAPGTRRPP